MIDSTRPDVPADPELFNDSPRTAEPISHEAPPRLPFPVVGIGGSAGGLEAFIEFFKAMPPDSGMAFVLIQHLPPDRESMIAEILSKHTQMPVAQVEDSMPVEANHVYVIRPGHTLTIKDGALHLGQPLGMPRHGCPVDDFFRSLAEEQRERAICIVMSGMGSNGSAGSMMVKAVGGIVIAQDPETAKFPSMPRHVLDTGNTDFVLRPEEMPRMLLRYAEHPYVAGPRREDFAAHVEQQALTEIIAVLRTRTRRDFSGYKKPTIFRRIQRRMSLNQVDDLAAYASLLRQSATEAQALSDDMMIHVTGFFRDPEAWDVLSQHVIRPLIAERDKEATIRCWASACASGEEAYTLAMVLQEAADAAGKSLDIKVFATDTADRMLSIARTGAYPRGIEAEISPERLERFFHLDGALYRVKKELRELVVFAPQNVIQDPPFSRLDVCVCRNLLIYLEPQLQRRVLSLLHFGLRTGGALFLGSSEAIAGSEDLFELIDKQARIYRRIGGTGQLPLTFAFPAAFETVAKQPDPTRTPAKTSIAQMSTRLLLEHFAPTAVTVDRNSCAVYFHGDTGPYLAQPPGEPTRDLLAMARENVRGAIRMALEQVRNQGKPATAKGGFVEVDGKRFRLEVTAMPLERSDAPGHILLSFQKREEALPALLPADGAVSKDVHELNDQLRRVKDELQSTIEELQATNEEMQASSEETMSINEELQSTNEELETSKEELQSLNEELTTVNVQLQTKMEELEATTNDLSSLLSSTDIAIIFLDTKLRIRRFTRAATELLDLITGDVGRPLSDLAKKFADPDLMADCQGVLDKLVPRQQEIVSDSNHAYLRRILPSRTFDNRINGVVITFFDVSDLRRTRAALEESDERFRQLVKGAPHFAMLLMDLEGRIVAWNLGAERMLGYSEAEVLGKSGAIVYFEGGEDRLRSELRAAAETGRVIDESWHLVRGGTRLWGTGVVSAIRNSRGELIGYGKVFSDETARKRAEAELSDLLMREQSARQGAEASNQLKDHFLATLSHELRTPLSAILVWSQLLQHNNLAREEAEKGLRVIEKSAEAQRQLLDDLLDTSRIASGKVRLDRTNIQVLPLVHQAIEAMLPTAQAKGVSIESNLDDVGTIYADPNRLRQVVSNLLTNAVKFTNSGGRVTVRLACDDLWAELTVADTGQGIDPEFLPSVFKAFSQADFATTRAYGGLGLGLAISKELAELHGGSISAHSAGKGQGATFVVKLPLPAFEVSDNVRLNSVPPELAAEGMAGAQILLVEDEPQTREAFVQLLQTYGARVTAVPSANHALEAFQQARPDVIISDIGLPEEDGYRLLQRIRILESQRSEPATPAIALTAFASPKDRRRAREAGFHQHIAKPVEPKALIAAVARLFSNKAVAPSQG